MPSGVHRAQVHCKAIMRSQGFSNKRILNYLIYKSKLSKIKKCEIEHRFKEEKPFLHLSSYYSAQLWWRVDH